MFSYHSDPCGSRPTKRLVLSAIAKIYDPLGALSPITFWAKCFMQLLWRNGYDWDQSIPDDLAVSWNSFSTQLPSVSRVKLRRHIPIEQCTEAQLIGFSDASKRGYSAVVNMRLSYGAGSGTVHLLTARSKVAPLKNSRLDESLSVPRLELCGALLLAQTLRRVHSNLSSIIHISSIRAWTDSTTTTCTRHRASMVKTLMGDLLSPRVCPSKPFSNFGVDYAGPLLVKESKRRNARSTKCYVAIFICMAVKAVHIEVVSDLTTPAFLASLQRFVARRGIPSEIYLDCGTNFQGAESELRRLWSDPVAQNTFSNAIPCRWHFNPPAAPHFRGLWEAAVRSMKHHLKQVIGSQVLTFEEMSTITHRIEAILNSRPITPLSSDPNDLQALTPGHFLIGAPLVALPDSDVTQIPMNRLHRWQLLDQFHQSLWKHWSIDYLRSLKV
ncbi:uncharacterized protein LOC103307865 [Acyrthosiphon pisum]|uniref:Integrase catalytic domain-containing protein n=1 Tax=Acyrthosiphon pisum TaxID=7029 RepID=A0A8R1X0L1_ACYPI|nr:uncharacterized protein LOC103307865 [Acyrthosiphon pisum]|eukprot:XP_008178496.1 PREDICTED: uncharacterized protein LOC103307865 [Acyrthosiphon pisum]